MSPLQDFLTTSTLAFMLTFVRMGTAMMIMPGVGDSFTPQHVRLLIALALSFALFPLVVDKIPTPLPSTFILLSLILVEFLVGTFFGTIARVFMMALDTAGMVISTSSSLANAQVFNPSLATQGSLMGAFMSITGVVMLFTLNLHHLLIAGLLETYELFPIGFVPDLGSMAQIMARSVSSAFAIGVKIGTPFILITMLVYVGMGVLSRLMPQVQVFLLAIPAQILLSLSTLMLVLGAAFTYWAQQFEQGLLFIFGG